MAIVSTTIGRVAPVPGGCSADGGGSFLGLFCVGIASAISPALLWLRSWCQSEGSEVAAFVCGTCIWSAPAGGVATAFSRRTRPMTSSSPIMLEIPPATVPIESSTLLTRLSIKSSVRSTLVRQACDPLSAHVGLLSGGVGRASASTRWSVASALATHCRGICSTCGNKVVLA